MVKETPNKDRFKHKGWQILLGIVCLGLAYLLLSRAFDTGSWWEYLGTLVFLILAFNRLHNFIKLSHKRE
jgi:fatty acid desaturase